MATVEDTDNSIKAERTPPCLHHPDDHETDQYHTATFVLSDPIKLGRVPTEGNAVQIKATGKLTLHGVTRDVTVPLEAKLVATRSL